MREKEEVYERHVSNKNCMYFEDSFYVQYFKINFSTILFFNSVINISDSHFRISSIPAYNTYSKKKHMKPSLIYIYNHSFSKASRFTSR